MQLPYLILVPMRVSNDPKQSVRSYNELLDFIQTVNAVNESKSIIGRFNGHIELGVAIQAHHVENLTETVNNRVKLQEAFYIVSDKGGFQYQDGHLLDVRMISTTYEQACEADTWFSIGDKYYILPDSLPSKQLA